MERACAALLVLVATATCGGSETDRASSSHGGAAGQGGAAGAGGEAGGGAPATAGTGAGGASLTAPGDVGAPGLVHVAAGGLVKSPGFKMVFSLGQSTSNQGRTSSPQHVLRGGFIGATGSIQ